jgi:putative colanic acid biosynthesis UDP-glucose lipid carrier transferase
MDAKLGSFGPAAPVSSVSIADDGLTGERSVSGALPPVGTSPSIARQTKGAGWRLARRIGLPIALLGLGAVTQELGWHDPAVMIAWLCFAPVAVHFALRLRGDTAAAALPLGAPVERRSAIVGANPLGRQFRCALDSVPGVRFCGFFDDRAVERLGLDREERLLGPIGDVASFSKQRAIDAVYIALPMTSQSRVADLLARLRDTTASVYFLPDLSMFGPMRPRVDMLGSTPVVRVCETPFLGARGIVKRAEDLLLGSVLLLASLPLMLLIAVAVKLDSPGPVIFRQRRHGADAREIVVYKFRTMKVLEDGPELCQARAGDPRVTRVGAFLRRYSLDELPQLVNVLQGRMSLVGPRPHAIAHTELYREQISGYMIRHKARPGITGWAQVNGLRGETDSLDKMKARVEYDLAYLSEWSLALDLSILARTVWVVLQGRNAH